MYGTRLPITGKLLKADVRAVTSKNNKNKNSAIGLLR
jgi:hypothetical protein